MRKSDSTRPLAVPTTAISAIRLGKVAAPSPKSFTKSIDKLASPAAMTVCGPSVQETPKK